LDEFVNSEVLDPLVDTCTRNLIDTVTQEKSDTGSTRLEDCTHSYVGQGRSLLSTRLGLERTAENNRPAFCEEQGRPSPLRPWCISPCFRFPTIFEKLSDSVENFQNVTFSRKIFRFSSAKISDDFFLAIDHKFRISPYFPCFSKFPPVSRKLVFPPLLWKMSPCFREIHLLFTYFMCISFPTYFDHDEFMHHPMHVLDAPLSE